MPFTDDPANVPTDAVRVLVGDTSTTAPDLTDNTIAFLLLDENDSILRAAARAAELLAAHYTKTAAEKRVGPLTIVQSARFTSKSAEFMKLATLLWNRAGEDGAPFAGGISVTDKAARVADGDRVRPAFGRGMMPYPAGEKSQGDREQRLSPPSELI